MAGLIPFNRRRNVLSDAGLDFYDMIDDFFNENWLTGRSLMHDTFKVDIKETDSEYLIEAEMPGVKKEEIDLTLDDQRLTISVKREENTGDSGKNYIHRERRLSSMSRSLSLVGANQDSIKAKLEDGVLAITIAKKQKHSSNSKIDIE